MELQLKNVLKDLCVGDDIKYLEILEFLKDRKIISNLDKEETAIVNIHENITELVPRYDKQYLELKMIGRGGFGDVFVSQYYLDKKIYAVKKIPIYEEELDYIQNYLSEILILSRLEHNNIVRYYTSWIEAYSSPQMTKDFPNREILGDSCQELLPIEYYRFREISTTPTSCSDKESLPVIYLYLQMELCKPISLYQCMAKMDMCEIIRVIQELIQGVKYLHSKHIVHRDIKPKNILFSLETNTIKLADFGLSCLENSSTRLSSSQGTYLYLDPYGKSNSKTVDIYSLGVIITELFCKFKTRMERIEVLKRLQHFRIPEILSDEITEVVSKCIHPDINQRYDISELDKIFNKINL